MWRRSGVFFCTIGPRAAQTVAPLLRTLPHQPVGGSALPNEAIPHSDWHQGGRAQQPPAASAKVDSVDVSADKEFYNFVGQVRAAGPIVAVKQAPLRLILSTVLGGAVVLALVCYFSTYTYVLTTNPSPHENSIFQRYPCDMAVIVNRWTHHRRVVEVKPELPVPVEGSLPSDSSNGSATAASSVEAVSASSFPIPIVERRLRVNCLLHQVYLFLQKTTSTVLVDTAPELSPYRFQEGALSIGAADRTAVSHLWTDRRPAGQDVAAVPSHANGTAVAEAAAAPMSKPPRLLVESDVRFGEAMNLFNKTRLFRYESTVQGVICEVLKRRYYDAILSRAVAVNGRRRAAYAAEMIRNGLLSGDGLAWTDIVPDMQQFTEEVFSVVRQRLGEEVLIYDHHIRLV